MSGKMMMTSMAMICCVSLNSLAKGAEPPKIISWSNSKTGDSGTAFQVKPGEKITFSVKAEGAAKYLWQVNREAKPQAGGASFTWTVPGKKGLWKIQVISTNKSQERYVAGLVEDFRKFPWGRWDRKAKKWITDKDRREIPETIKDGYYPPQCRKEWIVSTFVKKVKPGESIQKAIDAVPSEGGIVELATGVHEVKKAIFINKSNVTLWGTHDSEIRLLDSTEFTDLIPKGQRYFSAPALFSMNEKWEGHPPLENITFKGFKITSTYTKHRGNLFHPCQVNNLTIEGLKDLSFAGHFITTNGIRDSRARSYMTRSEGMRIIGNTIQHSRITSICARNAVAAYNTLTGRYRSSWGLIFEAGNNNVSIHHNYLDNTGVNGNIQIESSGAHVFNNICKGSQSGIWMRGCGSCNVRIENNIVTGAKINGIGLRQQKHWKNVRIRNNVVYNCPGYGIYGTEYGYGMTEWRRGDATIINNVIYNCGKGGIAIERAKKWTAVYTFHVRNNIIANNKGYGLDFDKGSSNYNNVFNNAKGNYNSVSPGAGDISVRPIFADPANGNFHLKSKAGRWDPKAKKWVKDSASSPCIDAGDPKVDFSKEPAPNGGRLNMGAYGNTKEASRSL